MNDITTRQREAWTKEFLLHVAQHLSNKSAISRTEYIVDICIPSEFSMAQTPEESLNYISSNMSDVAIHHRKDKGKQYSLLISHILMYHMKQLVIADTDSFCGVPVHREYLVPGRYKYVFSATRKTRKWVKLR